MKCMKCGKHTIHICEKKKNPLCKNCCIEQGGHGCEWWDICQGYDEL